MNTCDTCKHWSRRNGENIGECFCDFFVYGSRNDCPIDGLSYCDAEGYRAIFFTGRKFGCVHYEKPSEKE